MIQSTGVVVRVEGGDAWVRPDGEASACGSCAQRGACGGPSGRDGALALLRLPNVIHAHPGDAVVIRAADGVLLRAVWLAYGIPLLLALVCAVFGHYILGSEAGTIAGIVVGLGLGVLHLRYRGGMGCGSSELSMDFKKPSSIH